MPHTSTTSTRRVAALLVGVVITVASACGASDGLNAVRTNDRVQESESRIETIRPRAIEALEIGSLADFKRSADSIIVGEVVSVAQTDPVSAGDGTSTAKRTVQVDVTDRLAGQVDSDMISVYTDHLRFKGSEIVDRIGTEGFVLTAGDRVILGLGRVEKDGGYEIAAPAAFFLMDPNLASDLQAAREAVSDEYATHALGVATRTMDADQIVSELREI